MITISRLFKGTDIHCPMCGERFFPVRRQTMAFKCGEKVHVGCRRCGGEYMAYKSDNGALTVRMEAL
jgi:ribosomal protein L37E